MPVAQLPYPQGQGGWYTHVSSATVPPQACVASLLDRCLGRVSGVKKLSRYLCRCIYFTAVRLSAGWGGGWERVLVAGAKGHHLSHVYFREAGTGWVSLPPCDGAG